MIKIIITILFLLHIYPLYSLEFYNYEKAIEIQKKNQKIIMIDVTRTNCHYCINMKKKVFDDLKMSKWLEKRFIPVEINLDFDDMPFDIRINFTPTFLFVNKNGKIVQKIPGSWNIQDFKDLTKGIK